MVLFLSLPLPINYPLVIDEVVYRMKVSTVVTSDSFFDLLPSCYIMVSGLPQPAPLATVVCR